MKFSTSSIAKSLAGTVAAGAMAVSSASPVLARDHNDGIGAGEVLAGALIIGGIAAVAAAASDNDRNQGRYGYRYDDGPRHDGDYRYDRAGYGGYGGNGRYGSRQAVETCVRAAERDATRWSRGRADVTQVTRINRIRGGYSVHGRIAVDDRGGGWGRGGDRWNQDGTDSGRFACEVRHGQVANIDFSGVRGLR
jgi:hypothetical protein